MLAGVTLGGEDTRVAVASAAAAIFNDPAARGAVAALILIWALAWLITKPEVWTWLKRFRRRPQLYLYATPPGEEVDPWKTYMVSWEPNDCLGMTLTTHGIPNIGVKAKQAPEERSLVLHLLNAGPSDVRHVEVEWSMPDFDVVSSIHKTKVFGECVAKLNAHEIEWSSGQQGAARPLANPQSVKIPLIKANEVARLTSPEPFTGVFMASCLIVAREILSQPLEAKAFDPKEKVSPFDVLRHHERPMPRVQIQVKYTLDDGSEVKQTFVLHGIARQFAYLRKASKSENRYDHMPDGLGVGVLNLTVVEE